MKKVLTIIGSMVAALCTYAQLPDSDIFVADMKLSQDSTYFGTPENITNRAGYDNHPYFAANGGSIYYSASDNAQCDIKRFLFANKKSATITRTKESEFSPGFTPDGLSMTVVRIDTDSAQRAYTFPRGNPRFPKAIYGSDSIGYYCWLSDSMLAMFMTGEKNTLQILNLRTYQRKKVAENIGRCMRVNADSSLLYFVIKHSATDWRIHSMQTRNRVVEEVAPTLAGDEDFAVLKDGSFLMGDKGLLYHMKPEKKKWKKIADFTASVGTFTRIAVTVQENKIALVGVGVQSKKP